MMRGNVDTLETKWQNTYPGCSAIYLIVQHDPYIKLLTNQ